MLNLRLAALAVVVFGTLSIQACTNTPVTTKPPEVTSQEEFEVVDDPSLPKIVKVATPLPENIKYSCTGEMQLNAEICNVTYNGVTKTGYVADMKGSIKKWNADKTMSYYTITHKGNNSILTVPKFK
jgi:hypothetical protein